MFKFLQRIGNPNFNILSHQYFTTQFKRSYSTVFGTYLSSEFLWHTLAHCWMNVWTPRWPTFQLTLLFVHKKFVSSLFLLSSMDFTGVPLQTLYNFSEYHFRTRVLPEGIEWIQNEHRHGTWTEGSTEPTEDNELTEERLSDTEGHTWIIARTRLVWYKVAEIEFLSEFIGTVDKIRERSGKEATFSLFNRFVSA